MSYNLINRKYFLFDALKYKINLDKFYQKLQDSDHQTLLIMPGAGGLTKTPFDFAVHNKQITNVKLLYYAMTLGNKGILYSTIFDRNLVKMLNLQLNMKSYFTSSIPYVKVSSEHFPSYDKD